MASPACKGGTMTEKKTHWQEALERYEKAHGWVSPEEQNRRKKAKKKRR